MLERTEKKKSLYIHFYLLWSVCALPVFVLLFAAKFLEEKLSLLLQSCSLLFPDDGLLIKESLVSLVCTDTLEIVKTEQNCDVLWPKDSLLI